MTTINFKSAVGRIYFDGGLTDDGKLIRKAKTYSNVAEGVDAENLNKGLQALASLSSMPFINAEKIRTSTIND